MSVVYEVESDQQGIFSFRSVYDAYLQCRRRKRNTVNALKFEVNLLENLHELSESLSNQTYQPSRSICFVVKDPKYREVFAADFRDRVVHHLLVPQLEAIFEPKMIYDSYACRMGKGTHSAVERLQSFMYKVTGGRKCEGWFLQLDIRSFFMSIDRTILWSLLKHRISDSVLLNLTHTILFHDCCKDYIYKGDPRLMQKVPKHKSLIHSPRNKGIPIGNLTSQFFANVYLNELDQFVKHTLKCKYYIRYMDDFVILHKSRERLNNFKQQIETFVKTKLDLSLKPDYTLSSVYKGIDFLGYVTKPGYILIRNRVIGNLKKRLMQFRYKIVSEKMIYGKVYRVLNLNPETIMRLKQVVSSYLGHFNHACHVRVVNRLFDRFDFLKEIFLLDSQNRLDSRLEPAYTPINLQSQYAWFEKKYENACILFHVGKFFEVYGNAAKRYASALGLNVMENRRFPGEMCGFPSPLLECYQSRMAESGFDFVVVGQTGYYQSGFRKRAAVYRHFAFK